MASLASGLETRNPLRNRQEKNEFYFQLQRKNFLDSENETRVPVKKKQRVRKKVLRGNAIDPNWRRRVGLTHYLYAPSMS